jgi:hypothetical protein
MSISLHRLLSRLAAVALSLSPAGVAAAVEIAEDSSRPDLTDRELEDDLPIDREHLDPQDAAAVLARNLAHALGEMRQLSATHLAATWALSRDPVRRLALAHSLERAFPLVGASVVIDHLSRDPDPAIRMAAARAAWIRRPNGGDDGVLVRLVLDPDPRVRTVAAVAKWTDRRPSRRRP